MVEGQRAEDRRQRHPGAGSGGMHMGRQGLGKDARADSRTGPTPVYVYLMSIVHSNWTCPIITDTTNQ